VPLLRHVSSLFDSGACFAVIGYVSKAPQALLRKQFGERVQPVVDSEPPLWVQSSGSVTNSSPRAPPASPTEALRTEIPESASISVSGGASSSDPSPSPDVSAVIVRCLGPGGRVQDFLWDRSWPAATFKVQRLQVRCFRLEACNRRSSCSWKVHVFRSLADVCGRATPTDVADRYRVSDSRHNDPR
jgi:hypothetical protein